MAFLLVQKMKQKICIPFINPFIDRNKKKEIPTLFNIPKFFIGFQHVINSIDKHKYDIHYDDLVNINKYDFTLISMVSYYDMYNLFYALKGIKINTKIIIGGPAVLNIYPFIDKIYAACFGRCDNIINDILSGKELQNVYCRDYGLKKYTIGQPVLQIGDFRETEHAVGCRKKCFFCEYGFKYKFVDFNGQYGEYANGETFFKDIDFVKKGTNTTGLDGLTELERYVVNKPITNSDIVNKLNTHTIRDNYRLKLFTVSAYPFTDGYYYEELLDTISKAKTNPLTIMIGLSHFCPMPLTPMEEEKVLITPLKRLSPRKINNIKIMTYLQSTSYKKAIINSLFNRCKVDDINMMNSIISLNINKFVEKIIDKLPHIVDGGYVPVDYIVRPFNINGLKKLYKKRVQEYKTKDILHSGVLR